MYELGKDEVAIIFGKDDFKLTMPKYKDEDEVPEHALKAAAICIMLKTDKDFEVMLAEKMKVYLENGNLEK